MPRYLVSDSAVAGDRVTIVGDLAAHLRKSLRVAAGERLLVVTGSGVEHGVVVDAVSPEAITGTSVFRRPAAGEPRLHVSVVQAVIRELDDVIAAVTHAGASAVAPFAAARSVVRIEAARLPARQQRWQAIARDAAQLAARVRIPEVAAPAALDDVLASLASGTRILACDMEAPQALSRLDLAAGVPVALVIGPEGSLSPGELAALQGHGATAVHLGTRILPARSAAAVAVTAALLRAGDLDDGTPPPPWPQ
jgi:16S rRNA (uracil1498-N3)-methyltransferase